MKILITGATGFIGNKFLKSLDRETYSINILSRKKIKNYNTHICDFSKDVIPLDAFKNIDIVFHFAGYAHDIKKNKNQKSLNEKINFDASKNIIEASILNKVKKFIFISSTKAENIKVTDLDIDTKKNNVPDDYYAKSKKKVEEYLKNKCTNINMKFLIIRPALVYGPGVKGNLKTLLYIFNFYWFPPLPKTNNCKSMVHVDDLIDSINFLNNKENIFNDTYTITDGECYSARDIYEILCKALNKKIYNIGIPLFFFNMASFIIPGLSEKINKIFADEFYSSKKINDIGFIAKKRLIDINSSKY